MALSLHVSETWQMQEDSTCITALQATNLGCCDVVGFLDSQGQGSFLWQCPSSFPRG